MNKFQLALIQESYGGGSAEQTLEETASKIKEAAKLGADCVCLQELHTGPYFCQTETTDAFTLAEPIPGPSSRTLSQLAKQLGIVIIGSLFEERAPGIYHNTAIVLERDGKLCGKYRKMHIPDDPGFYEKFYFTPGDLGFEPIQTSLGKLGVLVCWDQWFPEAARLMALKGADILLYPTAIGWDPEDDDAEKNRQLTAWQTIQRAHAIANGIPVASCNRTGSEYSVTGNSQIDFWGHSFICGPQGEILSEAQQDENIQLAEIDKTRSKAVRQIWPYFRDRRIDGYGDIVKRFID